MFLRRLEIIGFRGINRLAITLLPNMVLIGENAWGKTSLLDALVLIFNHSRSLYRFRQSDFHISNPKEQRCKQITMLFTFGEHFVGERLEKENALYQPLFVESDDNYHQIYLRISGTCSVDNQIHTDYAFLDQKGREIKIANVSGLVKSMIAQFPVYAIRRHIQEPNRKEVAQQHPDLPDEIQAFSLLLQYYYFNRDIGSQWQDLSCLWAKVKVLCERLKQGDNAIRQRLFQLFSQLCMPNVIHSPASQSHPIVLFEDPDARLHPRLVAILWELISFLPLQRITTTNSVELLSQVKLHEICRLVRTAQEIRTYRLRRNSLSKQALRRLTFHIHYNRSLALFANTWLLVEGETEVWLLSALAEQMGINFEMEGIKIVEFAQCGLSPLIKYAKAMGIEWHVLTDGDNAGKKYADTVKSQLDENESISERLTELPKRDIEHFLYANGFDNVFIRLAHWHDQSNIRPVSRIIQTAIRKASKPDIAIALANEVEYRGKESIPTLFQRMFVKVLRLDD